MGASSSERNSRMMGLLKYRLRVTITGGRTLVGQLIAFDRHMNLVLADCEEFRHVRTRRTALGEERVVTREEKRMLGLLVLRGESVVRFTIESPPPSQPSSSSSGPQSRGGASIAKLGVAQASAAQSLPNPGGPGAPFGNLIPGAIPTNPPPAGLVGPSRLGAGPGLGVAPPPGFSGIAMPPPMPPVPNMPGGFLPPPPPMPMPPPPPGSAGWNPDPRAMGMPPHASNPNQQQPPLTPAQSFPPYYPSQQQ